MINIGITGTGSLVGQAIIKSIKQCVNFNNSKIIGFDYVENTVGSYWCHKTFLLPDILKKNVKRNTWINEIVKIVNKEKIDILLIGVDFELIHFAIEKEFFENKTDCKLIVSSKNVIEITKDKYNTYKFLKKNNLNHPKTFLYKPYNYLLNKKNISNISFPIILKPREGASSKGVLKIDSPLDFHNNLSKINSSFICQEYIGSSDKEYSCGVIYLDGKIKSIIVLKRTLKKGDTSLAILEDDKKINEKISNYIKKVIRFLDPSGPCNIQLRLDNNNNPKIFEINSRFSGTTFFRSLFGLNEVSLILNYFFKNINMDYKLINNKAYRFFDEKLIK